MNIWVSKYIGKFITILSITSSVLLLVVSFEADLLGAMMSMTDEENC